MSKKLPTARRHGEVEIAGVPRGIVPFGIYRWDIPMGYFIQWGMEKSGFSHGKMVDLSNMFHSYVSLPEDNIKISIDQWKFQDPVDGGT